MENYSEWLNDMLAEHRLSGKDLSDAMVAKGFKFSPQYVSKLRTSRLNLRKATEIANAMGWEPPMSELTGYSSTTVTVTTLQPSAGINIPDHTNEVLDTVKVSREWITRTYPTVKNLSNLAIFSCKGDSMEPTFTQEDTLLATRGYQQFEEDGIYIFTYHGQLLVKRIQNLPGKGYYVISDNPAYQPYTIELQDLEHVVVHAKLIGRFSFNKI